jgi:DNA helicase-2/ATP-dependent DNA helicase PcrA
LPAQVWLKPVGNVMLTDRLKEWRRKRAKAEGVPASFVMSDRTLGDIVRCMPKDWADLAGIPGMDPAKLERYGDELLVMVATVARSRALPAS